MLLLLSVLLTFSSFAATPDVATLARNQQWLNLMHYRPDWPRALQSQADGPSFFLSKRGKDEPVEELQTTLDLFRAAKAPLADESAVCRFPARYLWLKGHFPELSFSPSQDCAGFKEFATKSNAKSINLVFSSYFINTPASAFGHSFLRFNSSPHREDNTDQAELLDYGISFAARMEGDNVFSYVIKGLAGLSRGYFTAVPYYYKVREYNDFEFRDLWEYKLGFTQPQIDLMVAHVWELAPSWFDYLYFTENCAYHVLSILDVGNPSLHLVDKLPRLYVIPIDTIRAVAQTKGLVVGRHYRPSVLSRLELMSQHLSNDKVKELRDLAEHPGDAEKLLAHVKEPETKARMLEAAVEAYDFLNAKELVFRPKETIPERHKLLGARAEVDVILPDEAQEPKLHQWPDQGHGSQRWGLGVGHRDNRGAFATGSFRFALHDLLDPLPGQPTYSSIIMGDFNLTGEQTDFSRFSRLRLENGDFFRVSSFQPITHWQRNTSWDGRVGVKTVRDRGCDECMVVNAEAGVGATVAPKMSESFVSLLNKFHLEHGDGLRRSTRLGVGPEAWWRWVPHQKWSLLAIVGYKWFTYFEGPWFASQVFTQSLELRYHLRKDWSLYLKGEGQQESTRAGTIGLYNYF